MKKGLATLLSVILLAGTVFPTAAATEGADAKLAQITQSVKNTLDLDTTGYTSFHGDYGEQEFVPIWYLYWDGEMGTLSVSALEDGTIVDYSNHLTQGSSGTGQGLPTFPEGDPKQAQSAAQAFLDKVLTSGLESVELEEPNGMNRLDSTTYRFSGTILLHGLPSPLNYSVTVRAADNVVTDFWRDVPSTSFLGEIPTSEAKVSQVTAAESLKETLSLRLEYCLLEEGETTARLCFLPDWTPTYYIDAKSGQRINLTQLEEEMYKGGNFGAAADGAASGASSAENGLSEAEQAGIQKLEGVLSSEALDGILRSVKEYGLDHYQLISTRFAVEKEDENGIAPVSCTLRYSRAEDEGVYTRTAVVDARTGQVQQITSYIPWNEASQAALTKVQAQSKAETFLKTYYKEHATHLELYQSSEKRAVPLEETETGPIYSFQFARKENGYFFPAHSYTVQIDTSDGSVCGFSYTYDESILFDSPEGVIEADKAKSVWMDSYDVTLGYLLVPEPLDSLDAIAQRLKQMGYQTYYHLKLGYSLQREQSYRGIDAKSGTLLSYSWPSEEVDLSYEDVTGHWAEEYIQRLAQFNIGYEGKLFQPDKALTQWDLVCILFSLHRYPIDPSQASPSQRDEAYTVAYEMGAVERGTRNDEMQLTRSQLVKHLLDGAGYGRIAALEGIFTCSYSDRASISKEELGYAALAQGLGLISGPYAGNKTATRGQAAAMLCQLMES
ncbi:MAG: S-layer homology domain-containing protein [Lawsonibacter sp.]|jgi:hypothetical protein